MANSPAPVRRQTHAPTGFAALLDRVGYHLYWTYYYVEHFYVLAFEGLRRLVRLADPRVHSQRRRIRGLSEGQLTKPTNKFFVLVIFPGAALPGFTRSLIAALRESPFNLVLVSNVALDDAVKAALLRDCRLLIERENVGQDFGGYKDAIAVIGERYGAPERLVLGNDSVFYFREGLDRLIADLDGPQDFIGVSEVFDHHYHVASFLLSFGPRVIASTVFNNFWKRFRPLGTRRWNIFRGEGALTAQLMQAGFHPHVLFRAEALRAHLRADSATERAQLLALLPAEARHKLIERLPEAATGAQVVDGVIDTIMQRNQMHMGGFLFRKYLGLPVIKRDIVFREVYPETEMPALLADVDPPMREEALADLGRRGTAADLGLLRRRLYRHSAV